MNIRHRNLIIANWVIIGYVYSLTIVNSCVMISNLKAEGEAAMNEINKELL